MRSFCAFLIISIPLLAFGCDADRPASANPAAVIPDSLPAPAVQKLSPAGPRRFRVVHVIVPLCDNRNQGIIPVPAKLGNGQDPANNLYWGAMYGAKTFFRRSDNWELISKSEVPLGAHVLDSSVFRSMGRATPVYVVMLAYDGAHMKEALVDFFEAVAGRNVICVTDNTGDNPMTFEAGGASDIVCFTGHNGLMDTRLAETKPSEKSHPSAAVVLACKSHPYFTPLLERLKCIPLITTSGLMAPEAYTLDAVIRSWADGDDPATVRDNAAAAYAKYQKCSVGAAKRLFVARKKDEEKSP